LCSFSVAVFHTDGTVQVLEGTRGLLAAAVPLLAAGAAAAPLLAAEPGAVATGLVLLLGLAAEEIEGVEGTFPAAPARPLEGVLTPFPLPLLDSEPDTGDEVEVTRPRVRTGGLGEPSATLGAAANMGLAGLSPGMGFATGTFTVAFFALTAPVIISSMTPSHLRAGLAQERSWLIQLLTISLNRGVLNTFRGGAREGEHISFQNRGVLNTCEEVQGRVCI
jgi:hypothetical protein